MLFDYLRYIKISIHALREEGDVQRFMQLRGVVGISIHALREEGDQGQSDKGIFGLVFLSTPSARRATSSPKPSLWKPSNFYPRPPRGGRRDRNQYGVGEDYDFYPRPPRGGRPLPKHRRVWPNFNFYPRPPRGGRLCARACMLV